MGQGDLTFISDVNVPCKVPYVVCFVLFSTCKMEKLWLKEYYNSDLNLDIALFFFFK